MILKQYYLGCLAHASYLVGDEKNKVAVVIDPQRDIDQYLKDAEGAGLRITHVFLTHFHADFLAGHLEFRNRTGAEIMLGSRAEADFPFRALQDGEQITLGEVKLTIWETPGHTPEGISLLVTDLSQGGETPFAVLTGDTLFIGDVGRPDLLASIGVTADELAGMLHSSLKRLRELPDSVLVYPAHGAGSMCGKSLSKETVSTIGEQKKVNYAFQEMGLEEFKRLVTADQPEAPDYFLYDAIKNRQEHADLEESLTKSLVPLSVEEVVRHLNQGSQLVDVRDALEFAGGHFQGALNIGLQGKYATWCGSVLDHGRPIVLIAEEGEIEEAAMRLGRIGFDNVAGYLSGGMLSLASRPELVVTVPRLTAAELREALAGDSPPVVLDVRSEKEWRGSHLAGSVNIPLGHLAGRMTELPADREVVVHCEGGYRSALGCSLLQRGGRSALSDLIGGIKGWQAMGYPTESEGLPVSP